MSNVHLQKRNTWQLDLVSPAIASGRHFQHGRPDTASTRDFTKPEFLTMRPGEIPIKTGVCFLSQILRFVIFGHQSHPPNMCDLAFRAAKREGKAWQLAAIWWRNGWNTSAFGRGRRFTIASGQPPSLLSKLQENQQGSLPETSSVNDPSVNQLDHHWKECRHCICFILGSGKAIIVCTESCCILKIADQCWLRFGLKGWRVGLAVGTFFVDLQVLFPAWKNISVLAALVLFPNGFAGTCNPPDAQRKLWLMCACP